MLACIPINHHPLTDAPPAISCFPIVARDTFPSARASWFKLTLCAIRKYRTRYISSSIVMLSPCVIINVCCPACSSFSENTFSRIDFRNSSVPGTSADLVGCVSFHAFRPSCSLQNASCKASSWSAPFTGLCSFAASAARWLPRTLPM